MRYIIIFSIILVAVQVRQLQSKFIPVADENYMPCEEGKPFQIMDASELEVIQTDDTHSALNGKLIFKDNVVSPWQFLFKTERLERGQWVPGEFARKVVDFCEAMLNPTEVWYPLTKELKTIKCPIKEGTIINVDMISLSNFNVTMPAQFAGKWRIKLKTSTGIPPKSDCYLFHFDVVEV